METLSIQTDEATMARIDTAMRAYGVERADYLELALKRALAEDAPGAVAVTGEDITKLLGILSGVKASTCNYRTTLPA